MKIAVYGTLREGHGNHGCLMGSPKVGTYRIEGFSMVSLGGFPAVDYDEGGEITVEVYEVSPEAEARCNRLEGYDPNSNNNTFYDRVTIDTPVGEAELYIMHGVLEEGYEDIEDGDWDNFRQARFNTAAGW